MKKIILSAVLMGLLAVPVFAQPGTRPGGAGGGDASSANQTAPQATPGSDATKAIAVQGVTGGKAVKVDGSAVTQPVTGTFYQATQPVSASALPLPTGASTSANQATANTSLGTIATNSGTQATAANQSTGNTTLGTISSSITTLNGKIDTLNTSAAGAVPAGTNLIGKVGIDQTTPGTTNGVAVNSSALPTGASTSANQATANTSLGTIATNSGTQATAANQSTGNTTLGTISSSITTLNGKIDTLNTNAVAPIPAQASHGVNIGGTEGVSASGVTYSENPNAGGCRASTTSPTAVTDGQKVAVQCTPEGRIVVSPYSIGGNNLAGTGSGTTTSAISLTGMGAQGSGIKVYLTGCQAFRTDAGTTTSYGVLNDGATTPIALPAGGGSNPQFLNPLVVASNTAVTFTPHDGLTTVFISCQGFKAQ